MRQSRKAIKGRYLSRISARCFNNIRQKFKSSIYTNNYLHVTFRIIDIIKQRSVHEIGVCQIISSFAKRKVDDTAIFLLVLKQKKCLIFSNKLMQRFKIISLNKTQFRICCRA